MWLLVVAAGSGYLARCLQGAKRPRLFEPGDQGRKSSDEELLSEEALKVRERFEKLEVEQQQAEEKEPMETGSLNRSPSSQSSGFHDVKSSPSSKFKFKAKTWPCWPKNQHRIHKHEPLHGDNVVGEARSKQQRGSPSDETRHLKPGNSSDEYLQSFPERKDVSCGSPPKTPDRNPMRSVHIAEMPQGEASITLRTPLGDVSWQASKQDVESLGDLPSVLDWTSMAASQKFGLEQEGFPGDRSRRRLRARARSRSKDSSASATPMEASPSSITPGHSLLPSLVRKRKAAPSALNGFHDSGYLAKEVLLFAMGMHVGVSCMLLYHHSEVEKLKRIERHPRNSSAALKLLTRFDSVQQDDDSESTTSVVTVETKPVDQMAVLEAELEAELELMELNLKGDDHVASENGVSSISSFPVESRGGNVSPAETQHWCVSPRDLDRRLHILLEERQAKQIDELQTELEDVRGKLQVKEEELRSWKNRVYRLTQASLTSPTDDIEIGDTMSCDSPVLVQRPISRKKWFSDDSEPPVPVNGSLASLVSRCRVNEDECEETFELTGALERLSVSSHRGPVTKSCVSVSELLQRENRNGGDAEATLGQLSRMARRSSLGVLHSGTQHAEAQFHEEQQHLICVKSSPLSAPRDRMNAEVIRTVETKCRIEERFHASVREEEEKWVSKRFSRPRHSTGSVLNTRNRSQRQRRRWFS